MIDTFGLGWFGSSWFLPLLVAPFVGSFLGVLILRLPLRAPIGLARSACPTCGTPLGARDLVPLVSFLSSGGRCRHCAAPIGRFHLIVELAAIGVVIWAIMAGSDATEIWVDCGLGWTLLTLGWIDWTDFLLPDGLTLPLLLAGLMVTYLREPDVLADHAIAAALGYLSFQGISLAYRRLRGRDGLGGGDAKLMGAAGAWCGLVALPLIMLSSALLGLLAALGLALRGKSMTSTTWIPFGPCIAFGFWLVWLQGGQMENLIQWLGRQ